MPVALKPDAYLTLNVLFKSKLLDLFDIEFLSLNDVELI
jgi:hypothetical protein